MDIVQIIKNARSMGASDVHIVYGLPVKVRIDGELRNYNEDVLTDKDCIQAAETLLDRRINEDEKSGETDAAVTIDGNIRCRLNFFWQQGHLSSAIRILAGFIPQMDKLGLPRIAGKFMQYPRGIVLITGETGSGKSTTLAALLDGINHTRREHIITLEDPIEYIYEPDLCIVNQREIGVDTASYEAGLKSILREDPDIILIGEMRTLETIEIALTAAETGHLVFATLHTNTAADAIERMVCVFPGDMQQQIRLQLSRTLQAVVSQQLLPAIGGGRALACEVMVVNSAIRNLIREGKTAQIENSIATSADIGSISMDNSLVNLTAQGRISPETAVRAAVNEDYVSKRLGMTSQPQPAEIRMKRESRYGKL